MVKVPEFKLKEDLLYSAVVASLWPFKGLMDISLMVIPRLTAYILKEDWVPTTSSAWLNLNWIESSYWCKVLSFHFFEREPSSQHVISTSIISSIHFDSARFTRFTWLNLNWIESSYWCKVLSFHFFEREPSSQHVISTSIISSIQF